MAGISVYARPDREVRVAIVGPHELVERIMLSGLPGASQRDAWVAVADFARFYAGRGLLISD